MHVVDLMSGSGELWEFLLPRIGPAGQLSAVDFSAVAVAHARQRRRALAEDADAEHRRRGNLVDTHVTHRC